MFFLCKLPKEALSSLLKNENHPKFPKNIKDVKKSKTGMNKFQHVSDKHGKGTSKSWNNLHQYHSEFYVDTFENSEKNYNF